MGFVLSTGTSEAVASVGSPIDSSIANEVVVSSGVPTTIIKKLVKYKKPDRRFSQLDTQVRKRTVQRKVKGLRMGIKYVLGKAI